MDFRRNWRGKRILGDGKTWRGFFGGSLTGFAVGMIIAGIALVLGSEDGWGYGEWSSAVPIALGLSFGAMIGDAVGSFIKRRIGKGRGEKAILLDQYNFVVGAFVLVLLVNIDWFVEHYVDGSGIVALVVFLISVPLIHRGVNIIGYKMGKKDVPW